jgi:hypothetical protein
MKRKKLKLGLETIRVLTSEQLGGAAGASAWMCTTLVSCTCGIILTITVVNQPPDTHRYCA